MGNEEQMNFLDEKAAKKEQKKAEKEAKKAARESRGPMTRVKKGLIVTAFILTSIIGIGSVVILAGTHNAKEALKVQSVNGTPGAIQAIEDKFGGDIHGFWVWALAMTDSEYYNGDAKYIAGKCITPDGIDVPNNMKDAIVTVEYPNGVTIKRTDGYEVDAKTYPNNDKEYISSISYNELINDYVLTLKKDEADETTDGKENDNVGYSYKLVPKITVSEKD